MMNVTTYTTYFTPDEWTLRESLYDQLAALAGDSLRSEDTERIEALLIQAVEADRLERDSFGLNPIIKNLQTALIVVDEMGMRRAAIVSILLHDVVKNGFITVEEAGKQFGADVQGILSGLVRINKLYEKKSLDRV